jgi:Immunoglobulin I-set domain
MLDCHITAYPHAVNYWEKDGRRIVSTSRHRIEAFEDADSRQLTLSLRISDVTADDYGRYDCIAANALGTQQTSIHLFGSYINCDLRGASSTLLRPRVLV